MDTMPIFIKERPSDDMPHEQSPYYDPSEEENLIASEFESDPPIQPAKQSSVKRLSSIPSVRKYQKSGKYSKQGY
jgi:hypothetical protein